MKNLQKATFWSSMLLLSGVSADHHDCMVGGCPRDAQGQQMLCGHYRQVPIDQNARDMITTQDFINQSQELCVHQNDCNQAPYDQGNSQGMGLYYYCPGAPCPQFQFMDTALRRCVSQNCGPGQTLQADGRCQGCPPFQSIDQGGQCRNVCSVNSGQIVLQNGGCESCPQYSKPQYDNQSRQYSRCGPDNCGPNDILLMTGDCQACPHPSTPDASGRRCETMRVTCNERQRISSDGRECLPCPEYTKAQNQNSYCDADILMSGQYTTPQGNSANCQSGYEPDLNNQRRSCTRSQALCSGFDTIYSNDGYQCEQCPPYTRAQSGNTVCQADICGSNYYITLDGSCQMCQQGYEPDRTNQMRSCVRTRAVCTGTRSIYSPDGYSCINCEPYTRAQAGNLCDADICGQNYYVTVDGTCDVCQNGYEPDRSNNMRSCVRIRPVCQGPQTIYSPDGYSCIQCQPFARAQPGNLCAPDSCRHDQIIIMDGTCAQCPPNQAPDTQKLNCIIVDANCRGERQKYSPDRTRCIECEPFTRAQNNNEYCGPDLQQVNQVVTFEGRAAMCLPYTAVQPDQRTCAEPVCFGRDIIDISGTCKACPPYTRPNPDKRSCGQEMCMQNFKLTQDGNCVECPVGTQVSADLRFCTVVLQERVSKDRIKQVQFVSIAPLDRLLNQRDRNDALKIQVGCEGMNNQVESKEYDFDLDSDRINYKTCYDGTQPESNGYCAIDTNEMIECGPGESYTVQIFDLYGQRIQGLDTPPSLGSFTVTKEMMECLVDDKLQIHFEYGKRQQLAGAVACFDHVPYVRDNGVPDTSTQRPGDNKLDRPFGANSLTDKFVEDEIPFTTLNICHKNDDDKKRCFLYSYQITLFIRDSEKNRVYPLIEPQVYAKINFKQILNKLVVLPEDQLQIRFVSSHSNKEALRLQPEIYADDMPQPLKDRYRIAIRGSNPKQYETRKPCDDMKVADSLVCDDMVAYCSKPDDVLMFSIQGSGEVYFMEETCADFLEGYQDWGQLQELLVENFEMFGKTFNDQTAGAGGKKNVYDIDEVHFMNRHYVKRRMTGWLEFTYEIGYYYKSNEPKCFAGDHFERHTPSCKFQCGEQQCLLLNPNGVNSDYRRRLHEEFNGMSEAPAEPKEPRRELANEGGYEFAGRDIRGPCYYNTKESSDASWHCRPELELLPLQIPTRILNPFGVIPELLAGRVLEGFSSWQNDAGKGNTQRFNLIQQEIELNSGREMVSERRVPQLQSAAPAEELEEGEEQSTGEELDTSIIALAASFDGNIGPSYSYNLDDKVEQDNKPPSHVQITKLPENGQLISEAYGKKRVVELGDVIIPASLSYSQEGAAAECTVENEERCKDTFSFIPYSSWQGQGAYSKSMIQLNPIEVEEISDEGEALQLEPITTEETEETLSESQEEALVAPSTEVKESEQVAPVPSAPVKQQEPVGAYNENPECNQPFPNELIGSLVMVIVTLMGTTGSLVYCLFYKASGAHQSEHVKKYIDQTNDNAPSDNQSQLELKKDLSVQSRNQFDKRSSTNKQQRKNHSRKDSIVNHSPERSQSNMTEQNEQSPEKLLKHEMKDDDQKDKDYSIHLRLSQFDDQQTQQINSGRKSVQSYQQQPQEPIQQQSFEPNMTAQTPQQKDALINEIKRGIKDLTVLTDRERFQQAQPYMQGMNQQDQIFMYEKYMEEHHQESRPQTQMDESAISARLYSEEDQ